MSYATLQQGMEYFFDEAGYIAYTTVYHPVFARRTRRVVLADPVCSREDLPGLIKRFLVDHPYAAFVVISEQCAAVLRRMGFKANCLGYEVELPVSTYNTNGNWKELDLIKRARNEARREGISIKEVDIEAIDSNALRQVSQAWIKNKKVNDREIWVYARRPVFAHEPGVRKFVAWDRRGIPVGFSFYDPIYRGEAVVGYSANIVRCDENRFGKLATAVHMVAIETFRGEGVEVLNLCLAPFAKLERGKFNDDPGTRFFLQFSERYGNDIYNFKGLSFHKSKYRGTEKPVYFASNAVMPSNDIYLAFLSADISRSYFSTLGKLLQGMLKAFYASARSSSRRVRGA